MVANAPIQEANRRPFTDYYDADAVAAVQKAFRWELEYFGYQLG